MQSLLFKVIIICHQANTKKITYNDFSKVHFEGDLILLAHRTLRNAHYNS